MKIDESVRVAPPYSKDNEAKKSASLKLRNSWPFWFMSTAHLCEKFLPGSLDLFSKLSGTPKNVDQIIHKLGKAC